MNITKAIADWDQIETDNSFMLSHFSDDELLACVAELQSPTVYERLTSQYAVRSFAFCLIYEHRRRNGGFGREPFNPVADQTL